jgi:hypothetical protein
MMRAPSSNQQDIRLAEWLYEEGVGEARAALIEHGKLVEALIEREDDAARAGAVAQGRLVRTLVPKKRGIVRLDSGEEALLEPIPPRLAEGGLVLVEILREAIPEQGRDKHAKARAAQPGMRRTGWKRMAGASCWRRPSPVRSGPRRPRCAYFQRRPWC